MSWFTRKMQGITTKYKEKKDIPEGLYIIAVSRDECDGSSSDEHDGSSSNW